MTFLKANIASLVASAADYLVTVLLVKLWGFDAVIGSICGTITGGVINFTMGRHWTFAAGNEDVRAQARRYLFVWIGNLLLNTTGVFLLSNQLGLDIRISKVAVSVLVAVGYNYPMQKRYVFKHNIR